MSEQDDINRAFELAAQWEVAVPIVHHSRFVRRVTKYCPDCEAQIRATPEGWRCPCSQWRFATDDTAERIKLIPDEAWKR